jgi:thiol-disulfide isomerase/thioredoxin
MKKSIILIILVLLCQLNALSKQVQLEKYNIYEYCNFSSNMYYYPEEYTIETYYSELINKYFQIDSDDTDQLLHVFELQDGTVHIDYDGDLILDRELQFTDTQFYFKGQSDLLILEKVLPYRSGLAILNSALSSGTLMTGTPEIYKGEISINSVNFVIGLQIKARCFDYSNLESLYLLIDKNETGIFELSEQVSILQPFMIMDERLQVRSVSWNDHGLVLDIELLTDKEVAVAEGFEFPNIRLNAHDEMKESVSISDFRGSVLVLNWWGSGCTPCIFEIPELNRLASLFQDQVGVSFTINPSTMEIIESKSQLVQFLSINPFDNYDIISKIIKDNDFKYNHFTFDKELSNKLGVGPVPQNMIIDKDGILRYHSSGFTLGKDDVLFDEMNAVIKELLN